MKLDVSTLGNLRGGRAGHLINQEIQAAIEHCKRYPHLLKARNVNIKLSITPDPETGIEAVDVQVTASHTAPPRQLGKELLKVASAESGETQVLFPNSTEVPMFKESEAN